MPAGQGKDAERFAAALEQGTPPGFPVDDDLARELEIAAMLRSRAAEFDPHPDAKARAKQRLMAVLAAEQEGRQGGADVRSAPGPRPAVAPPSAAEQTAPLGRVLQPAFPIARDDVDATAVTAQMAAVTAPRVPDAEPEVEETSPTARPGRRSARHSLPSRPAGRSRGSRRPAASPLRRRAMLVGAAALAMIVALSGAGIVASRDALPGDNLYALKRVAESAGLALTFDDAARARRHLEIAATRLDELEQLVERDPQLATANPELFTSVIQEFDAATGEGSRMLLAAQDAGGATALSDLQAWATEQSARLTELRPALPLPAVAGADGVIEMLTRLVGRTEALETRSSCTEVTSGAVDELGPLPAEGACAPRPVEPTVPGTARTGNPRDALTSPGSGTPTAPGSEDPSGVTGTPGEGNPALLPELRPDGTPLQGGSTAPSDEGSTSRTTGPGSNDSGPGSGPAPLLPPITLPPLMPGMPGITIG
jgi:hypothetical protein